MGKGALREKHCQEREREEPSSLPKVFSVPPGEESLTIFVDKRKLSRRAEPGGAAGNSSGVSLETLHQLAASYFIDRESTLRRLHHIQIASTAIKVGRAPGHTPRGGPSLTTCSSGEKWFD